MNTGETIALIKAFGNGGGGSSLPSVTSADNGKVLAVKDGAWAADKNTILLPITNGKVELTGAEINALVEEGKTVMLSGTDEYDVYVGNYFNVAYFANLRSNNSTYKSVGSNKSVITTTTVPLPSASASDNGKELIVKNGAWAKQQKKFVVTLTPTAEDYSGTMDKTVAEINAAYEAGMEIWFSFTGPGARIDFPVNNVVNDENEDFPGYKGVSIMPGVIGVIGPEPTSDGTTDTYTADLYSLTPAS